MKLKIRTMNSGEHEVDVPSDGSVQQLVDAAAALTGVEGSRVRLLYAGHALEPGRGLAHYRLQDGHVVHMVERSDAVPGPMPSAPPRAAGPPSMDIQSVLMDLQGFIGPMMNAASAASASAASSAPDTHVLAGLHQFLGRLEEDLGRYEAEPIVVSQPYQSPASAAAGPSEPSAPAGSATGGAGGQAASPPPPRTVVHSTISCDGCGMSPLVGVRYKSAALADHDLCEACFRSGRHAHMGPFAASHNVTMSRTELAPLTTDLMAAADPTGGAQRAQDAGNRRRLTAALRDIMEGSRPGAPAEGAGVGELRRASALVLSDLLSRTTSMLGGRLVGELTRATDTLRQAGEEISATEPEDGLQTLSEPLRTALASSFRASSLLFSLSALGFDLARALAAYTVYLEAAGLPNTPPTAPASSGVAAMVRSALGPEGRAYRAIFESQRPTAIHRSGLQPILPSASDTLFGFASAPHPPRQGQAQAAAGSGPMPPIPLPPGMMGPTPPPGSTSVAHNVMRLPGGGIISVDLVQQVLPAPEGPQGHQGHHGPRRAAAGTTTTASTTAMGPPPPIPPPPAPTPLPSWIAYDPARRSLQVDLGALARVGGAAAAGIADRITAALGEGAGSGAEGPQTPAAVLTQSVVSLLRSAEAELQRIAGDQPGQGSPAAAAAPASVRESLGRTAAAFESLVRRGLVEANRLLVQTEAAVPAAPPAPAPAASPPQPAARPARGSPASPGRSLQSAPSAAERLKSLISEIKRTESAGGEAAAQPQAGAEAGPSVPPPPPPPPTAQASGSGPAAPTRPAVKPKSFGEGLRTALAPRRTEPPTSAAPAAEPRAPAAPAAASASAGASEAARTTPGPAAGRPAGMGRGLQPRPRAPGAASADPAPSAPSGPTRGPAPPQARPEGGMVPRGAQGPGAMAGMPDLSALLGGAGGGGMGGLLQMAERMAQSGPMQQLAREMETEGDMAFGRMANRVMGALTGGGGGEGGGMDFGSLFGSLMGGPPPGAGQRQGGPGRSAGAAPRPRQDWREELSSEDAARWSALMEADEGRQQNISQPPASDVYRAAGGVEPRPAGGVLGALF